MTPEMHAAYLDLRQLINVLIGLIIWLLVVAHLTLVLKVLIYISVIKQLHACWSLLTLGKGWTSLMERRRDDAAQTLGRVERAVEKVEKASDHPAVPVPLPVTVVGTNSGEYQSSPNAAPPPTPPR